MAQWALCVSWARRLVIQRLEAECICRRCAGIRSVFGRLCHRSVRGALLAIPRGHREAGLALGLSRPRILFRIVLPQMWRIAIPGLGNLFMILMKDTALVLDGGF